VVRLKEDGALMAGMMPEKTPTLNGPLKGSRCSQWPPPCNHQVHCVCVPPRRTGQLAWDVRAVTRLTMCAQPGGVGGLVDGGSANFGHHETPSTYRAVARLIRRACMASTQALHAINARQADMN
jgi:hypothetical protein